MKFNKWTVALAAIGVVSLASAARADEAAPKMNAVQTALSSTTLSGYVDTAGIWRPGTDLNHGAVAHTPTGTVGNDGFTLNAIDLALDHPEDESPWAAGYHVELMAGPNSVGEPIVTTAVTPASTDFTIRQAYLTLRTPVGNGIDWKIGVWDTVIGYESSSDPLNPNYSRSYGWGIEPTTHTGVLGTYKINDMVTVQAGLADSSNVGAGTIGVNPAVAESQKAYMGDVQFTAPDSAGFMKGATLTVGAIDTAGSKASKGTTSLYSGITLPTPVSALKFGSSFDFLSVHTGGGSAWVIGLYGNFQATDKLSFNMRTEYVQDDTGVLAYNGGIASLIPRNEAEEFTATVQYNLWVNVLSRVEFRWDHTEHGNFFGSSNGELTPGVANRNNDFLIALNLIYQF